jgi:cytochrome c oxidase assembly protein subunit 15
MIERRYAQLVRITLVLLYLVILAGSIVRMSGSGMGCPDWPKCFGKWVPPTSVDQLPSNYKEEYAKKREIKVVRFAKLLSAVGFDSQAQKLLTDKAIYKEEDFNAAKTWTEYINRLIGALAGLFVLLGTIFALKFYRNNSNWFWISLLNLILILITAWFGAVVVATNLMPWIITVHMMLAVALVMSQINLLTKVVRPRFKVNVSRAFKFMLFVTIILTLAQIVLGTQVRQQIDAIASNTGEEYRAYWINFTDVKFLIHRSGSIALLLITLLLMFLNFRGRYAISLLNLVFIAMLAEVILGVILNYLGMPKFAQPFHLLIGTLIIGLQYYIYKRTSSR